MARVYFVKFEHKSTGKILFKFGHTTLADALKRFDVKYDSRYGDFDITCVASIYGNIQMCQGIEHAFKALYPKNIRLEEYLGEGNWDNFSGITEMVDLSQEEYDKVRIAFYNIKHQVREVKN